MATEKTDVVIVGVGAAGGILAAELGKAGLKVIGLERGPRLKTADFEPDELRYFQRQDLRPDPKRSRSPGGRTPMRARSGCRRRTTATRPAAAPCITARCRGASTRTISASARKPSSATARRRFRRRLVARRLAAVLCGARAVLRQDRIRPRRLRQGRQSAGQENRRRQRRSRRRGMRDYPLPPLTRPAQHHLQRGGQETRPASIFDAACDSVPAL